MSDHVGDALRRAAGRQVQIETREKVGEIGIGRGAACAPPPPPNPTAQINARIREAARLATNRVDMGVDLADVL
jgi:hypothetical protein